jgi:hypothetical protein
MTLDTATATLPGSAIGSLLTLAGTIVPGIVTLRKESVMMDTTLAKERQAGKLAFQKEREARTGQQNADFEKWRCEQTHSRLSSCAYLINLYIFLILTRQLTDYLRDYLNGCDPALAAQRAIYSFTGILRRFSSSVLRSFRDFKEVKDTIRDIGRNYIAQEYDALREK